MFLLFVKYSCVFYNGIDSHLGRSLNSLQIFHFTKVKPDVR